MLRHIIPIEDSKPHYDSISCPCNPTIVEGDGYDACIHRAFDGRDLIIAIEILLKMRCKEHGHYLDNDGNHSRPPDPYHEDYQSSI